MGRLYDLCSGIEEPEQTFGRPRLPLADRLFCIAFKVYCLFSGRRFTCDLYDAWAKEYISKVPHFNSVYNYFDAPEMTPILHSLIAQSSLPLRAIETDFAVDSSGFGTSRFVRWYNARYGHEQDNRDWLKAHLICGVRTNIVTGVEITGRYTHDAPFLPALVEATTQNFQVREVSADKAYSSQKNIEAIANMGAMPYVPFRTSSTGNYDASTEWGKLWHYYSFHRDDFVAHYHKRSNIESTYSMIKAKFGDGLRSKTDTAQVNELLCKVLCHNCCVVIQSIYELGIDATFWEDS